MYDRLCLIDLSVTADHLIRAEDLLPASTDKLLAADLVLFRTGFEAHRDDQERWANHNPGFASECARALEETAPRARAVGVDGPSAAAARHLEEGGEFHRRWLSGNLATPLRLIYEDLRLAGIEDRRIDRVIALPLRLVHADGAPCTVIAVCMNQIQVQRVLGARNLDHGRWGALFAGALKLTLLFIIILPATAAVVLYPNLDNPDQIWPILAFDLLPVGLWGGLLAALVAALVSTINSILNAISTIITMDFVRFLSPNAGEGTLVGTGRVTTAVLTVIAVTWAPQISNFETLWAYFQSAVSFLTPSLVAVFVVGIFWRKTNGVAAIVASLSLGVAATAVRVYLCGGSS